jgi:hypothetical protein
MQLTKLDFFAPLTSSEVCKILEINLSSYVNATRDGQLKASCIIRDYPPSHELFHNFWDIFEFCTERQIKKRLGVNKPTDEVINNLLDHLAHFFENEEPSLSVLDRGISDWLLDRPEMSPIPDMKDKIQCEVTSTRLAVMEAFLEIVTGFEILLREELRVLEHSQDSRLLN